MIARRRASCAVMPALRLSSMCNCRWLSSSAERSPSDRAEPKTPDSRSKKARTNFNNLVLVGGQEARHDRRGLFPLARVALDLFAAGTGELVELSLAVVL